MLAAGSSALNKEKQMAMADVAPVQGRINWRAVIWSTIIAGLLFAALEMILVPLLQGGTPWGPLG